MPRSEAFSRVPLCLVSTRCTRTSSASVPRGVFSGTLCGTSSAPFKVSWSLMVADWDRGWVTVVLASDTSEWRYGITAMTASSSEVAKTGRVAERSRFRHAGVASARAAAFQAGDLHRWAHAAGVDEQSLLQAMPEGSERWELDERFLEVPADWRAKSLWKVLRGMPWRTVQQYRLVVVTLELEARVCYVWWTTVFQLGEVALGNSNCYVSCGSLLAELLLSV